MREAGYQLDRVQHGLPPDDGKPMTTIGTGVMELRVWDEAVYVLHCFQKKTQQTAKRDIDLARKRLKDLLKELAS